MSSKHLLLGPQSELTAIHDNNAVNWQIGKLIATYHRMNFMGYQGEILSRSPDNDLTLYIAARMLWDAD